MNTLRCWFIKIMEKKFITHVSDPMSEDSIERKIKKNFILDEPPPYIDGIRINSPHYLVKIRLDPTTEKMYLSNQISIYWIFHKIFSLFFQIHIGIISI